MPCTATTTAAHRICLDDASYALRLHHEFPGKGPLLELHIRDDSDDLAMTLVPAIVAGFRRHMSDPAIGARFDCRFNMHEQTDTWLMIEFWTRDLEYIRGAVRRLLGGLATDGYTPRLDDALPRA